MKIMFFCWAQEMKIMILYWTTFLTRLPQDFIVAPLIRLKDKTNYEGVVDELGRHRNISVHPIYLKSPDSRFENLLNIKVLLSDFLSIFRVIKSSKPNVIVCFYVLHAYPLVVLKKILKFSLCVVAMGSDVNLENGSLQRLVKKVIYRNCDLIFAVSWKLKEKIEKEHNSKVMVIPFSADPSFFKPLNSRRMLRRKWGITSRGKVILTVCKLDKNKGVDILIKSLKKLNMNDASLLIAGEGVERKSLEKLSSVLGIQEKVSFLGFMDREKLLELYNLADIFALASYSEGLPKVLMESMACGCIPIVTDVGDVKAVVVDGFNGFIVNTGDYEKFAEKLKEALSLSEEKMTLMKNRARRVVANDFDNRELIKRMIDNIEAIYLSRNQSR
jgi:glycosyltransferase involved in cell wall biosynthesis